MKFDAATFRSSSTLRVVIDFAVVAIAFSDGILGLYGDSWWQVSVNVLAALGLLLRRRWPWISLCLALPALYLTGGPIAAIIALHAVAAAATFSLRLLLGACAVFVGVVGFTWGQPSINAIVLSSVYALMTSAGAVALGQLQRTRAQLSSTVTELHEARDGEHRRIAREAAARERAQLAREMHDVVSHQVSLIAVQAGALQVRSGDPETVDTAQQIRVLAATTLDELRQMLSLLRADGSRPTGIAPQPGIDRLDELFSAHTGPLKAKIDLPSTLSAAVQRALYRTVQEGLTNVRKHAGGSAVTVRASHTATRVILSVVNTEPEPTTSALALPSAGLGIKGLTERASHLGGTLRAVTRSDGGFLLELEVPRSH